MYSHVALGLKWRHLVLVQISHAVFAFISSFDLYLINNLVRYCRHIYLHICALELIGGSGYKQRNM